MSADNRLLERALDELSAQLAHERQRADRAEQRVDEAIARADRAEKRLDELLARQATPDSPTPDSLPGMHPTGSPSILVQRISDAPLGLTVPEAPAERRHWRAGAIVVLLLVICAALVFVVGSR